MSEKWFKEGKQPERGDGGWGTGAPLRVRHGHQVRDLEDGAGICSPGRWPPKRRRQPIVGDLADGLINAMKMGREVWDRSLITMMAGKFAINPL